MKLNIREKYNEENYRDSLLRAAKAWEEGYDVDLSELYDIDTVKKISIPKYCFEKNVFNYFSIETVMIKNLKSLVKTSALLEI